MDITSATITVAECLTPPISKRYRYHRDIYKNMDSLKKALDTLNGRKADLKTKLESEVFPGVTEEVEEVKLWLRHVEEINCEIEEIKNKVPLVKLVSRIKLGKKVAEMIPEVKKIHEEGVFAEGSLVRKLPQRGIEMPTKTVLGGKTTTEKTKDEILACLADEKVTRIGVYGMGGIGKTTVLKSIHNELVKPDNEIGKKFDKVIWITASKGSDIKALQNKIGHKLGLSFSEDNDEENRATELYNEFKKATKKFLLIIDDLWEAYPLESVGVPDPILEKGCKIVLTTRHGDVCRQMFCDRTIAMGFLSEEEAVELFLYTVGKSVAMDPKLGDITRLVAEKCARLPLVITTVAGSLRDNNDLTEWEVALMELKDATATILDKVMETLRSSYNRLKGEKHKECLLYCALYPEDFLIEKNLLIDQLIAEGFVERYETREDLVKLCRVMLNKLVSNCLLIKEVNDNGDECVTLHDSIRDMAIKIMRESPNRFFVETGDMIKSLKPLKKWDELVEKVSMMGSNINVIPFVEPPNCPRLSTLFLNDNPLEYIAEDFFIGMEGLRVLDLSWTYITRLPNSISSLTNLVVLLLNNCHELDFIPDLSNLTNLIRLDLSYTCIQEVPQGVEKLTKLMYLHLHRTEIKSLPKALLRRLSDLHYLSIIFPFGTDLSYAKDLGALKKLKTLEITCLDYNFFIRCTRAILNGDVRLDNFNFEMGIINECFSNSLKNSGMMECTKIQGNHDHDLPILLPTNVENLFISERFEGSLFDLVSIKCTTKLRRLTITKSFNSEWLFHYSPAVFPLLHKIEELDLTSMHGLRGLVGTVEGDETVFPQLPIEAFSSLKKLIIEECCHLKTLFVLPKDASLPKLEWLVICHCDLLEEILVSENNDAIMTLPSLKKINLSNLPRLKSVPFIGDALSSVEISECPSLEKVAFLESKPYVSSLQYVDINKEPWKSFGINHFLTPSL